MINRQVHGSRPASRRALLSAAPAAPFFVPAGTAVARSGDDGRPGARPLQPVPTAEADWRDVAAVLGRPGRINREFMYHTAFPRRDMAVVSHGVSISPGLALGSHVAFVRYEDDSTLLMGDLVLAETELQQAADALQTHGIAQTALHKHLLSHSPDTWWCHVHAHGDDAVALARGVRDALARTGTPPAQEPDPSEDLDLDIDGVNAELGTEGYIEDGVFKCVFARRETIVDHDRVLPSGLGATTALIFQPLGGGRAALAGDFVMTASEVQPVLRALRAGGISLVTLHNHGLRDEPRLFFVHLWAVSDAVRLARGLRPAVDATHVEAPQPGGRAG